nr:glyoxysomal fatty acid beta-oxidation multifunctional protein MFP-A [Ipomoea batatas]
MSEIPSLLNLGRSADVAPLHFFSSKFETTVDCLFLSISTVNRSEATADAANIQSSPAFFCRRFHSTPPPKPQSPFFRLSCVTRDRHYPETVDSSPTTESYEETLRRDNEGAKGKFSGCFDIAAFGGLQGEKVNRGSLCIASSFAGEGETKIAGKKRIPHRSCWFIDRPFRAAARSRRMERERGDRGCGRWPNGGEYTAEAVRHLAPHRSAIERMPLLAALLRRPSITACFAGHLE